MRSITVSAPGKLMLLGEHAVVYGYPCIVTAVGQRMYCKAELIEGEILLIDAPDVGLMGYKKPVDALGVGDMPKGARFVEAAVKNFREHFFFVEGVHLTIMSEFSSEFGFGSSSASVICVIKALSELFKATLSKRQIFNLAYKTVLDIQKKGSGFDVAAAIFGGTLYFVTGGKVIKQLISVSRPKKVSAVNKLGAAYMADSSTTTRLPLIVGYSGSKADTVAMIEKVARKKQEDQEKVMSIFDQIGRLVEAGRSALLENNLPLLGKIMNKNQELLSELGVSTARLDAMIAAARNAGAFGAKLSGAGGGDCMICLSEEEKQQRIKEALVEAGGQVVDVEINVEGVRVEK
jgi:mevalonate kinase